jgi:hypothetical protein
MKHLITARILDRASMQLRYGIHLYPFSFPPLSRRFQLKLRPFIVCVCLFQLEILPSYLHFSVVLYPHVSLNFNYFFLSRNFQLFTHSSGGVRACLDTIHCLLQRMSKPASQRNERLLNELRTREGNDKCADCGSGQPRWASWNLGIWLCVRCAVSDGVYWRYMIVN